MNDLKKYHSEESLSVANRKLEETRISRDKWKDKTKPLRDENLKLKATIKYLKTENERFKRVIRERLIITL